MPPARRPEENTRFCEVPVKCGAPVSARGHVGHPDKGPSTRQLTYIPEKRQGRPQGRGTAGGLWPAGKASLG